MVWQVGAARAIEWAREWGPAAVEGCAEFWELPARCSGDVGFFLHSKELSPRRNFQLFRGV